MTLFRILGVLILSLVSAHLAALLVRLCLRMLRERKLNQLRVQQLRLEVAQLQTSLNSAKQSGHAWEGWRKFRVHKKIPECADCHSLFLVPHDGKPLPIFRPGQYLAVRLQIEGEPKPVVRCYSLSQSPNPEYFRCTIKKIYAPDNAVGVSSGKASSFLNDTLQEGDLIDVKSPRGTFVLDETDSRPVVLLAAGIGITPILAMLQTLTARSSKEEIYLFFGVRNGSSHPFRAEIATLARAHSHLHVTTCYSQPEPTDQLGHDYDMQGHVTLDLLRQKLPSSNFVYYLCGPTGFMEMARTGLRQWGVSGEFVRMESFGPSAGRRRTATPGELKPPTTIDHTTDDSNRPRVVFDRSKKQCEWAATAGSLLELAESVGVAIDSGCRSGNCGTCATAIKSGLIDYREDPEGSCEEGSCLTCVAVPKSELVLDA